MLPPGTRGCSPQALSTASHRKHTDADQVRPISEGFDAVIGGSTELAPGVVSRALAPAHVIAVASPAYLKDRTPPADPAAPLSTPSSRHSSGIAWRSASQEAWVMAAIPRSPFRVTPEHPSEPARE